MQIKRAGNNDGKQDARFITSDSCFFNVNLPAYSTPEVLRERLLYCVTVGAEAGIDADDVKDLDALVVTEGTVLAGRDNGEAAAGGVDDDV